MRTIYIDPVSFKCYTAQNAECTLVAQDTFFFDNKCDTFIEGYRFVPAGESWTREDGEVFYGEMIGAWKDFRELDAAQRQYEKELLFETQEALNILLGGVS